LWYSPGLFGLYQLFASSPSFLLSSLQYLAPEVLLEAKDKGQGYDKAVDLWSLGVILYILYVFASFPFLFFFFSHSLLFFRLSGTMPFNDNEKMSVLEQVRTGKYAMPAKLWNPISTEGSHSLFVYSPFFLTFLSFFLTFSQRFVIEVADRRPAPTHHHPSSIRTSLDEGSFSSPTFLLLCFSKE
jgi:serine/threonine protein kinase